MAYVSLYRKWRPQTFADVVGQESIVTTLKNSLEAGRISHAYLFAGPRGTGKTTVARIFAKGLNCETGPTAAPCGTCGECQAIASGTSMNVVEIDGASNRRIDDVRELRGEVQFTPINARYKVYIIDEVHMLTTEAFNALLKTLEEPPAHVVFIFATTDPHKLPLTILSRVQRYDFGRFSTADVVSRLSTVAKLEEFSAQGEALGLIAEHAGGSMRDALSILEKCAAFAEQISVDAVAEVLGIAPAEQIERFTKHVIEGSRSEALQIINHLYDQGKDLSQFAVGVMARLRQGILEGSLEDGKAIQAIETLAASVRDMRFSPDPRIVLELAALKITSDVPVAAVPEGGKLEEQVRKLEQQVAALQAQLAKERKAAPTEEKRAAAKIKAPKTDDVESTAFLIDNWLEFLSRLRSERLMQCEAFLREGSPVEVKGDQVIVAFPRDRGFHKASIEQEDHREPTQRVLSKFMGRQVRLECVFQDETESPAERGGEAKAEEQVQPAQPASPQQEQGNSASEDFLKASMEMFGGRIISKPKQN
ncbi:MAG TPA: DNA polymerase III subunit gamma/tau [Firmicutes bacterium]|nr:DNA polymerase III subunit gamma/tau [Bacillota bacterium]HHT42162.1 DNA polymerase III subunit gamma/tau [Bacillota bacterium]